MKTCFKCGETKSRTEFYKHKAMADGLLGKCKTCTKVDKTAHRNANLEKVRCYDRERGSRRTREDTQRYRQNNPVKAAAHRAVENAVKRGDLRQEPCEECGTEESVFAHHDDYNDPLKVRWLCAADHAAWHREHGEGVNG